MREFVFSFLLLMGFQGKAQDRPAVHGMLMFGKDKIYLSHLPMFHSPHDYQVILEVELDPQGKKAYQASLQKPGGKVHTISPEKFSLPELIAARTSFKAEVYRGHFERGGVLIDKTATLTVKKVLLFNQFSKGDLQESSAKYFVFGNQRQQFLAHQVTAAPDFDQILEIKTSEEKAQQIEEGESLEVAVLFPKANKPWMNLGIANVTDAATGAPWSFSVQSLIYLEFGDLSE